MPRISPAIAIILSLALGASGAAAQDSADRKTGAVTGLPLPRFVSIKADQVNARVGPGPDYDIAWVFRRPGLPVEILAEFETWRQVRDSEGSTGWVAASLVSGRRTAVVAPWAKNRELFVLASSRGGSDPVAKMEAGAIVDIGECDGENCAVYAGDTKGWVPQKTLWGVYPLERIR